MNFPDGCLWKLSAGILREVCCVWSIFVGLASRGYCFFILGPLISSASESVSRRQSSGLDGRIDRWPSGCPVNISSSNQPNYYFNNKKTHSSFDEILILKNKNGRIGCNWNIWRPESWIRELTFQQEPGMLRLYWKRSASQRREKAEFWTGGYK